MPDAPEIREATAGDADVAGRMLFDFNVEFGDDGTSAEAFAARLRALIPAGEAVVLLAGEPPAGIAVLRSRPALWADGLDAYLEELYVRPDRRGRGIGRALLDAACERARERGAIYIALATGTQDTAARRLYESAGFTNLDAGEPLLYYERDL
ncbi:MAG TPA: GNAT family N-acetyltransferase [Solirubrobacterales bacterium]|jgi:ribosomal protein S18 acetylase RimI-like enzyme